MVKNPPANVGDVINAGWIPSREDALEEGMTTHSSILALRIPWTEEPGGHRVANSWTQLKQPSKHIYTWYRIKSKENEIKQTNNKCHKGCETTETVIHC